jgi:hypothetical protein
MWFREGGELSVERREMFGFEKLEIDYWINKNQIICKSPWVRNPNRSCIDKDSNL